jgi:hypothetical protein
VDEWGFDTWHLVGKWGGATWHRDLVCLIKILVESMGIEPSDLPHKFKALAKSDQPTCHTIFLVMNMIQHIFKFTYVVVWSGVWVGA